MPNDHSPYTPPQESPMTCLPAKPFMGLGDSSHAPVLDYNMEVRSCLDAVVMIPIRIPIEYIKAEWFVKPIPNIWDTIKDMTWEQILAEVQAVLSGVPGQFGIFINSHLLDGTNVHWDFEEGETIDAPNVLGGGYPVSPIGGGGTPTKGGAYTGGGSTPIKGGAYTGGGSPIKGGGANTLALNGSDLLAIATNINNGLAPMISSDLYGVLHIEWLREPKLPRPTFYMVNHLKICTYAGNYGAGKTVHTHTLYPDEIFNFSLRTYKKIESVRLRTDNVLDSFSQSSSESLEKIIDKNKTTVDATTLGLELGAKIGAKFGIVFPVDVIDAEVGADGNIGGKTTYSKALTKTVQDLSHTIDKHCAESAASRVIQVNTSTTDSVLTEEEQTITRVIKNINKSRTLNIVHRQLHQQYLSITYLNEVTFMFTNGYPETLKTADIEDLLGLLIEICNTQAQATEIHDKIMLELCNVVDYQHQPQAFIECRDLGMNACCNACMDNPPTAHQTWISKKRGLSQTAQGFTVPGIILDLKTRIMPTDSVICEALLGQGEALDCYNMQLQQAAVDSAKLQNDQLRLENMRVQQAMDLLNLISDPIQKAELYKKIFGTCCNTPQSGCCCGNCNGNGGGGGHGGEITR